uniref:Uncharacterized protein n=1 Tax=Hyaloperonospora arabidopsidis (strain Emoy2) TaxID=559515 RepID=M4B6E7_HYAAE
MAFRRSVASRAMAKRSLEPGVSNALVIIIATATEGTSTKQYTRMSVEVVSLGVGWRFGKFRNDGSWVDRSCRQPV